MFGQSWKQCKRGIMTEQVLSDDGFAREKLDELRLRLRHDDPMGLNVQDFLAQMKSALAEEHPTQSSTRIPQLINQLKEVAQTSQHRLQVRSVGTVQHIGNGVATLSGLPLVHLEELVNFPNNVSGMVLNLDRKHVDVILLSPDSEIRGGDLAEASGKRLSIPVGLPFLGRMVTPLGRPLDGGRAIPPSEYRPVERIAPGVIERAPVNEPLYTGTKILDALVPLGRGQRQLIIGDRQTGKTSLALDAILAQKDSNVKCIYVSISQKKSSTLRVLETLKAHNALSYTCVIVSSPDDPPALRYLAPYAGITMAEFLLDEGMDVLIVFDDLSKHADTYRELSLLLRRPPGREAYPGDIFYLHSRLLERACKLNEEHGGGSITALPIVSTQRGDISAYIVTNLISITDGQIVLDANAFNKGRKPAIDIGRSVSRVGSAAQQEAMKSVIKAMKLELAQYEEVARFAQFGAEVNEATQKQIDRGQRLQALFGQPPQEPLPFVDQVLMFYAITHDFMDGIPPADVPAFAHELCLWLHSHAARSVDNIRQHGGFTGEDEQDLLDGMKNFAHYWGKKTKV